MLERSEAADWLERAVLRLAECEAELSAHEAAGETGRSTKLEARAERYRDLIGHLRRLAGLAPSPGRSQFEEIRAEFRSLRRDLLGKARDLAKCRARLADLRRRWKLRADGEGPDNGSPFPPDLELPAPDADAPEEERLAHELLRRLLG